MMHTVLELESFAAGAKSAGMTEDERFEIIQAIAEDPKKGDLIKGTGGARKIRFPKAGAGKSSGYRVITYYAADDVPVMLLDVFDKGTKVNLTQGERNELKRVLAGIAESYRKTMRMKIAQLREQKVS